ncbi:MAG: type II toxin-antitoxin system RelE/ParE family toxin [Planctomycetia bacterium]|nr:type II toxin-antitoxin system RelE/ParE family toxin [Planctomycetia bacterium]
MNHRFLAEAFQDLRDMADWYEAQSPGLGDQFTDAAEAHAQNLAAQPRLYGRVPRAPSGREIRETLVPRFLVRMVYEVTATEVVILSVTHARSRRQPWRRRLP